MEATTVYELMDRRAKLIEQGKLGHDRDTVGMDNRHRRITECRSAVHLTSTADKSDPFVRQRVASHLAQGVTEPEDYAVRFVKEQGLSVIGTAIIAAGGEGVTETPVLSPRNRSIPCI